MKKRETKEKDEGERESERDEEEIEGERCGQLFCLVQWSD